MIEEILYGGISSKPRTIVSIQSVSLGGLTAKYLQGLNYFEERNFFLMDLLRNPSCTCLFVLSDDIDKGFHQYALNQAVEASNLSKDDVAKRWKTLFVPSDGGSSLTEALLRNPNSLQSLRVLLQSCPSPILDFWAVSELEIELARTLDLPNFGLTADFLSVDSKSNGREIFREVGISIPKGEIGVSSIEQAREALVRTASESDASAFLIKLNCEEAGNGIARVERSALELPLQDFITSLEISKKIPVGAFLSQLAAKGGVVEEFIMAPRMSFPSVKMVVSPGGQVSNLATHDQVLNGMAYAGSRFPADREYRDELIEHGYRIAVHLAKIGVRGVVSVDFMATRNTDSDRWSLWGLEINARKGATTHPYFWTRSLTGATYNEGTGELISPEGPIRYRSSEYIHAEGLGGIPSDDLIQEIKLAGLAYDAQKRRGTLVHMATCLQRFSKFGATFIGSTDEEVDDLYVRTQQLTQRMTAKRRDLWKITPPY